MEPPRMPYPRSFSARFHVDSNINLCLALINHDHEMISVQVLYASAWCGWVVISRSIGDPVFSCREMKWSVRSCLVQNITVLKFSSALTRSDLQINCFLFSGTISRPGTSASCGSAIHFSSDKGYIPRWEREASTLSGRTSPTIRFLVSW